MGAPCDGVPGVPGWGPDPQFALGGTGPPVGASDLPEGGLLSMDLCAALLLLVRLQWHIHTCQHMSRMQQLLDRASCNHKQASGHCSKLLQHSTCCLNHAYAESPGISAEPSHLQQLASVSAV